MGSTEPPDASASDNGGREPSGRGSGIESHVPLGLDGPAFFNLVIVLSAL